MDERIKAALELSKYMITLENQKSLQYEKFLENSVYYFNGNKFTATSTLVSFINFLIANGHKDAILIDDNNIPVLVDNLIDFSLELYNIYSNAAQIYFTEYSKIKNNRTVSGLLDL